MTPSPFKRDSRGLLEGVSYPVTPFGDISWRALIKPEFLYPNHDYREELEARFGKKLRQLTPEELMTLEDRQLLVRLEGWRDLLRLRGYRSLKYRIEHATAETVSVTCDIEFIGNHETNMEPVTHSDVAGASIYSVSSKMHLYLEAMAANRAFARCVRAFLGIEILGKDEFDPEVSAEYLKQLKEEGKSPIVAREPEKSERKDIAPHEYLRTVCQNNGFTFEQVKASGQKIWADMKANPESAKITMLHSDPSTWIGFNKDIPVLDCATMITRIQTAVDKKAKKKG